MNRDKLQAAEQFRKALQLFAAGLGEEQAIEIATVYPTYGVNIRYKVGDYFTDGENAVGDPQLYKVLQEHTSQTEWVPKDTPALYEPIGLSEEGYPVWARPSGVHDAYNVGDVVDYSGTLYVSALDGNVWSPEEYPAGWEVFTGKEETEEAIV